MVKAILWDNDGVLVDTERLYFQAGQEILATQGVELTRENFIEQSLKKGESVFDFLPNQDENYIDSIREKRNARYIELLESDVEILDGVVETLEALYGRVHMGIVTGSHRNHFDVIHTQTDLLRFFEFVLAREDYDRSKPHPDAYLKAMKMNGWTPDECVVIEDSERGCVAAAAAGLRVLAIPNELSVHGDFSPAYKVLKSVREVVDEVEQL